MLTNLQMESSRFGHVFGYMYICMYIHILCIWWMWLKGGTYYAPLPYLNCIAMAPGKLITKNSSICLDRYRSSSATAAKCRAIFKLLLLRQLAGKIVKWARKKGVADKFAGFLQHLCNLLQWKCHTFFWRYFFGIDPIAVFAFWQFRE